MRHVQFITLCVVTMVILAATYGTAAGQETQIAWSEDFDAPDSPALGSIYYKHWGSGKSGEDVIIRGVANGVLRYGLKYDPERRKEWLNLVFGDFVWDGPDTEWGPFDSARYPFVEIGWRGSDFIFYYHAETASGQRTATYCNPPVIRTETDDQGRQWNVSLFRLAPDSSVPTVGTAVKLLAINLAIYSPQDQQDAITEIDYIQVRGFTAQEAAREDNIAKALQGFQRGRWAGYDDFFPFGVYVGGYLRSYFEYWGGDYEGAYGNYARHHLNYVPSNDEVKLVRFGHDQNAVESYIQAMQRLIEAARATGMKLGADVRNLMEGRDPADGYQQLLPITQRLAEAFATDEVIVSWKLGDEPGVDRLVPMVMTMRALHEADPLDRPQLMEFNSPPKMESYAAYLNLNCWDRYPIVQGNRNPWAIRDLARGYREILPDRPMWVVLQSFATRPPTKQGEHVRPSDAELRLMAHLALAEGAKGLMWWSGWCGWGQYQRLVTHTGQPNGGMLSTLSDLGRRLIPIGKLLLQTDHVDNPEVRVIEEAEPSDDHALAVDVLAHRQRPVNYLVVVNEDLGHPRAGHVVVDGLIVQDERVYDLYSLAEVPVTRQQFAVETLAGGDGRFYVVCSPQQFTTIRNQLHCAQAAEKCRVLTPDITIARRWGIDLSEVQAALSACNEAIAGQQGQQALAQAERTKDGLATAIAQDSVLSMTRKALADMSQELAELSLIAEHRSTTPRWWTGRDHTVMVPNPDFLELSGEYWRIGRSYRDLYSQYLAGETADLWENLNQTRQDLLLLRDELLGYHRERLAPATEPQPE